MRKLNFIIGAASGLFGGMLLSNKKFRQTLKDAKDPSEAARIIGHEMHRGGKEAIEDARKFMQRPEVQSWLKNMKHKAGVQCKSLQEEAEHIAAEAAKVAQQKVKQAKKAIVKKFG
jgi:uncharacterized protein YneF (UPF0154 family)